jgi:hypothetical protein
MSGLARGERRSPRCHASQPAEIAVGEQKKVGCRQKVTPAVER